MRKLLGLISRTAVLTVVEIDLLTAALRSVGIVSSIFLPLIVVLPAAAASETGVDPAGSASGRQTVVSRSAMPSNLMQLPELPKWKQGATQAYSAGQWKSGEQIYTKLCTACHATGIGPTIVGLSLPPIAVATMVRHGQGTMPTFRQSEINDRELQQLGEWLQQSKAPSTEPAKGGGAK